MHELQSTGRSVKRPDFKQPPACCNQNGDQPNFRAQNLRLVRPSRHALGFNNFFEILKVVFGMDWKFGAAGVDNHNGPVAVIRHVKRHLEKNETESFADLDCTGLFLV